MNIMGMLPWWWLGALADLWKGGEYKPMAVRVEHDVEASHDELDREVMLNLTCPKYVLIDLACDIVVSEGKVDDLLEDALRYRDANPDDEVTLCIYEKKSVLHL